MPPAPYQRPPTKSVLPPLIPQDDEYNRQDESLISSLGKLFSYTGSSIGEIFGGLFSRKKAVPMHGPHNYPSRHGNSWPVQESFVIPREDEPPPIDPRDPTPRKGYSYAKDIEKARHVKQSRSSYYNEWNRGEYHHHPQQQQPQRHVQHQKHRPASPRTYYEAQNETNEVVFGAVQEQEGRREAVVIKAVDYGAPAYNDKNVRSRYNYMSYSSYG